MNPFAAVTAVLPEESVSGAAAPTVGPPPAQRAVLADPDEVGPVLAVLGVFGVVAAAFAIVVVSRLGGAGARRGWRRARIVEVVSTRPRP